MTGGDHGSGLGLPELLLPEDSRHGVARFARELHEAVQALGAGPTAPGRVHVQFTDRLYGARADEAAAWFESLAATRAVTVTLHDLPQASDGSARDERSRAYLRVARAASGVVCNSHHERLLLDEILGEDVDALVVPLPVDPPPGARPDETQHPLLEAAVLGFYYPGKGHDQVADALAALPEPRPGLRILGAASAGHETELDATRRRAESAGVDVSVTGYLSDADLRRQARRVALPVVAHQHVSASGSLNSWLSAGRRPLVRASRYAHEMAALRPGSATVYDEGELVDALAHALADPASTWLSPEADLRPSRTEAAEAYLAWWRDGVAW